MSNELFHLIFFGMILYVIMFCVISNYCSKDFLCFSPKANYKHWDTLNWFGVWVFTILYWIAFLPFTVVAFVYWLFTVGRKQ